MDRDDVVRMAREAGCDGPLKGGLSDGLWEPTGGENVTELMHRFAHIVRNHALEEAASEVESYTHDVCASNIRSMKSR